MPCATQAVRRRATASHLAITSTTVTASYWVSRGDVCSVASLCGPLERSWGKWASTTAMLGASRQAVFQGNAWGVVKCYPAAARNRGRDDYWLAYFDFTKSTSPPHVGVENA